MTTYGITSAGFVIKPLTVIKSEIEDSQRTDIDPGLNQTATSLLGQLNGIFADKISEIWELNQAVYNAMNPDSSEDEQLDNIAALCPGMVRNPATKSLVTTSCNLDTGTYLAGTLVANVQNNETARFISTTDVTVSSGPSDEAIVFEAETAGATDAPQDTLEIAEPVSGWNSMTNSAAQIGLDIETDAAMRLRREDQIRRAGSTHVDAILADVLEVDEIIAAATTENDLDVATGGLVPHSIRVVVWDGDPSAASNTEILTAIFESKSAGITTNGAISGTVTDSQGFDHTITFDRATELSLDVEITVTTTDEPTDYQAQIKTAIIDYVTDEMTIGDDVIIKKLEGLITDYEWVDDLTNFDIGWVGGALSASNLTVAADAIATSETANIAFV